MGKLTDDQVKTIREMAAAGAVHLHIAERFGISGPYVSMISRGIAYKRAPGPICEKRKGKCDDDA